MMQIKIFKDILRERLIMIENKFILNVYILTDILNWHFLIAIKYFLKSQ
jgi:hypothetical protein